MKGQRIKGIIMAAAAFVVACFGAFAAHADSAAQTGEIGEVVSTGNTEIPETAQVVTIGSAADFDDFAAAVNYDNPTPSGSDGYYQGVKASWNKNLYVKITADIDMSEVTFTTAIGSYGNGGGFSGTLDGCGHTLSNYKVSGNWNYARALFRQAEDITVKNITFDHFVSDGKGVADNKTRPAGVVFASVLGTKNVFENVTVTDSVLYGDNGLGILTGYGSGDYYNTYVTEYTFTNCTISNCTIYSETDRAAILGEFGRDGDVILTISDCTFENNTLHAKIDGVTTTSDLPVWYNHAAAVIERDGVFYTYEHFGYAEEGKDKLVEVNYALKAANSGDTIILVKDIEVTEDEAKTAFAKSVDINKDKTNSTAPDGYGWDTEGNLVKIIARIGETGYWDLDDAINAAHPGQTVVLLDDIDLTAPVVVGEGKSVTLDLNGKTITNSTSVWNSANKDWSLISVRGGDLTINDSSEPSTGKVHALANDCYAVDVQTGGKVTINGGDYLGNWSTVYVKEGAATITGGRFDMTQFNDQGNKQHLINASDTEYKAGTATITISGGEFVGFNPADNTAEGAGTDFCADGYTSVYDEDTDTYSVVVAEAKVDGVLFATLAEALTAANAGDTITLLANIDLTAPVVVDKKVTLDLNGKTITNSNDIWNEANKDWSLISVRGGDLTINDSSEPSTGKVHALANDCYAVDVQTGGKVTINGGDYLGNWSTVYVKEGEATITGGHFDMTQVNDQGNKQHLINASDAEYKAGTATITISGGEFVGFDPENNTAEGAGTDFCADGYVSTDGEATDTYVVQKAEKCYTVTIEGLPSGTTVRTIAHGKTLKLAAPAKDGFTFVGWSGGIVSTEATASVVITGDATFTANYIPIALYTATTNAVIGAYKEENDLFTRKEIVDMAMDNPTIEVKEDGEGYRVAEVGIQLFAATTLKDETTGKPNWKPLANTENGGEVTRVFYDPVSESFKFVVPATDSMKFFKFVPKSELAE